MTDKDGFYNGIFKDVPGLGFSSPIYERAELLRAVSKRLINAVIDRSRRRQIILDLSSDFGVSLSERGIEHYMDP